MTKLGSTALTAENTNIDNQVNQGSITQPMVCQMWQDIIDSMWNQTDSPLTLPPANITKAALATAIGASTLNPFQWLQITNRADSNPLWVQCLGVNTISPFGIWVQSGKACMVIMDYVNGYEGETYPFIGSIDAATQKLFLTQVSGQANVGIKTIIGASAALTWSTVSNNSYSTQNITVAGAAIGDPVILGIDNAATTGLAWYNAWVSAANNVTIAYYNFSGTSQTPAGTFTVKIIK